MKKITLLLVFISMLNFAQTPIQVFTFDGTMSNNANTATFAGQGANAAANTSYVAGVSNRLNTALECAGGNTSYLTTITNLPVGNSSRTISFWFKNTCTAFCNQNVFSYGANSSNQAYGLTIFANNSGAGNQFNNYGFGNDVTGNFGALLQGQWYLYVCTFDGTLATVYRNGVQVVQTNKSTWNTAASTAFRLGMNTGSTTDFYGAIDDLKIYDVCLNATQVSAIGQHRFANILASSTLAAINNQTSTAVQLNYRVDSGNLPTDIKVEYGTTSGVYPNIVTMQAGLVNSGLTETNYTLNGLQSGTQYFYRLTATNESGGSVISERTFSTTTPFSSAGLVAYFPFENNLNSHNNSHSLTPVSSVPTYVSGQVGQSVYINNNLTTGNSAALVNTSSINNALIGSEYTVSFWADNDYLVNNDSSSFPTIYEMFGSAYVRQQNSPAQADYGYASTATSFFGKNGLSSGLNFGFHHYTIVHKSGTTTDRADGKIYVDGELLWELGTGANAPVLYRFNTNVYIGGGAIGSGAELNSKRYRGKIDELYIYNRALLAGEILSVMGNTNQTLIASDFNSNNLKFSLYPNPATNIVNIELATELKSIEIYSLQGQKVLSSNKNQVDVSTLSKGMYLVRVEDVENGVSTQKLIVE